MWKKPETQNVDKIQKQKKNLAKPKKKLNCDKTQKSFCDKT